MELEWDEAKRQQNLIRHGLDFANAEWVLDSPYRLDIPIVRGGKARIQSFAYVFGFLAVLLLVHRKTNFRFETPPFRAEVKPYPSLKAGVSAKPFGRGCKPLPKTQSERHECLSLTFATERNGKTRVISFRPASREESEVYYEWLENDFSPP